MNSLLESAVAFTYTFTHRNDTVRMLQTWFQSTAHPHLHCAQSDWQTLTIYHHFQCSFIGVGFDLKLGLSGVIWEDLRCSSKDPRNIRLGFSSLLTTRTQESAVSDIFADGFDAPNWPDSEWNEAGKLDRTTDTIWEDEQLRGKSHSHKSDHLPIAIFLLLSMPLHLAPSISII
jgi:hypothetical protein